MPPLFPLNVWRRSVNWFVSDDDCDTGRASRGIISAATALSVVGVAAIHLHRCGLVVVYEVVVLASRQ